MKRKIPSRVAGCRFEQAKKIMNTIEFIGFQKMARLNRECVITEKIDGTNAQIFIADDGTMLVGSRTRWLLPENDNHGFANWCETQRSELLTLGRGRHFGEWWGQGINRNYGLKEKRFSLFNTIRWCLYDQEPQRIAMADPRVEKYQKRLPACCGLVPVLRRGVFSSDAAASALYVLSQQGSAAVPGFMNPEGIVVYHVAGNVSFKVTLGGDGHKEIKN